MILECVGLQFLKFDLHFVFRYSTSNETLNSPNENGQNIENYNLFNSKSHISICIKHEITYSRTNSLAFMNNLVFLIESMSNFILDSISQLKLLGLLDSLNYM